MLLSLNLNNLSTEGSAAFVLAIIFTILSVAGVIFFARHTQMNKILLVVITLVMPFIAVFCWVYLLLDVLKFNPLVNLGISIGAAVGYVLLALAIAYLVAYIIEKYKSKPVVEEATENTTEPILLEHTPEEESEVVEETVEEEKTEEETVETVESTEETEEESEETEEGVVFSNEPRKTFAEQLAELKYETHRAYEEILAYAQAQAGTKTKEAKYQVTVSVGRMKLVQFKFIRGALVSSFMAGSSELKNYSAAEKAVKIKEKPVLIEVGEGDSVDVAKNMVDIVYKNITDAKQELKETKKAERKAKKAAMKAEENAETAQAAEEVPAETETQTTEAQAEEAPKKKRGRKKKSETQPVAEEQSSETEGEQE